jgi:hypothetical protein
MLGGLVCTLTLLASPKLGPRLYFASVALVAAGICGWLFDRWKDRWARRSCAVIAVVVLVYVEVQLIAVHSIVGPIGAQRADRIEHSPPGSAVVVPRYPFAFGRYFLGDDLLDPVVRDRVAGMFHLASVELEPASP